jgi:GntR family transcriptional regulator
VADADGSFPYRRIVAELRTQITSGQRAPGDRLPSENELADLYGTSRPTVRRAIAQLKAEGLVVTEQGRATFVRSTPHVRLLLVGSSYRRHRDAGVTGFNAQVTEQGQHPEQRLTQVSIEPVSAEVSFRLDLDPEAQVVVRRRVFLVNDHPVSLCDSYYPATWAADTVIAQPARIPGGVHRVIEDPNGPIRRHIARSVDELIARMPTLEETAVLVLSPGVPVVRILRTVYDVRGFPIEVQDTIAAGDRHEFRYEVALT